MLSSDVSEAIRFIRDNEPADGYVLGFSGGKDSIVTYSLAKLAGVRFTAYLSLVPGNDNPDVLRFVRTFYPDVKFTIAKPGTNFFKEVAKQGLPSRRIRWCCSKFKESASWSKKRVLLTGVRAEESYRRAMRGRIATHHGTVEMKPVFHWKEWQIWDFIDKLDLSYPSLYDTGQHRVGCVVCPYALSGSRPAIERMLRSMRQYPSIWQAVKKAAEVFFYKKELRVYKTFGQYWNAFLTGFFSDNARALEDVYVPI